MQILVLPTENLAQYSGLDIREGEVPDPPLTFQICLYPSLFYFLPPKVLPSPIKNVVIRALPVAIFSALRYYSFLIDKVRGVV